jgi:general secretion pathway protein H
MSRREEGFTLAEMLVVLAILALTTVLILPASRRSAETQQFISLGNTLAASFRQARMEAIGKNRETALRFDLEKRLVVAGDTGRAIEIPADIGVSIVTARGDVAAKEAVFRFFPDGTANGGQIDLKRGDRSLRIAVSWLTGAVSVDGNGLP